MYPVTLGFEEALRRIESLRTNGHKAEALVTTVFTFEKTVKRSLKCMAIRRGFTSAHADILFSNAGFKNLQEFWPAFDPRGESLSKMLGNSIWQHVPAAVTMRNKLAHGERVYNLADCEKQTHLVMAALQALRAELTTRIGFDGWSRLPVRRKSALQWLG
ncbi:conserved hypothetical protein [Luteimonas sp. 9C]|uniref:hypothetical protein n=1 Tax=Luteimonas sp. 9C TaxID=2653148 RepID=UPI0012F24DCB|nr:hypothetical protein [Luteimonas sp. 9C]VXB72220.1 conserved hypothetical protein [Luteimonas sp. 9C]